MKNVPLFLQEQKCISTGGWEREPRRHTQSTASSLRTANACPPYRSCGAPPSHSSANKDALRGDDTQQVDRKHLATFNWHLPQSSAGRAPDAGVRISSTGVSAACTSSLRLIQQVPIRSSGVSPRSPPAGSSLSVSKIQKITWPTLLCHLTCLMHKFCSNFLQEQMTVSPCQCLGSKTKLPGVVACPTSPETPAEGSSVRTAT